jgi:F0F1-type ATP synthase assembly protein I
VAAHCGKKPYRKAIVTGIISIALYVVLLMHQGIVNNLFSRGGVYALLPIVTAFIFCSVHGCFTGSFWTVFGVEAKKRQEVK